LIHGQVPLVTADRDTLLIDKDVKSLNKRIMDFMVAATNNLHKGD